MDQRIYHGQLDPDEVARALCAHFTRGNLVAQKLGDRAHVVVQVASRPRASSGGQTALTVALHRVEDGLAVQVGQQAWLGVAASLGMTALSVWRNPLNLLGRLDDLAQDIENLQLTEQVWRVVEDVSRLRGASLELSERLRRLVCAYCQTANPVGEPSCLACGAPLGSLQPQTCTNCGFVVQPGESACPNCGQPMGA
jgi:hypothetical protein